jgi:hypothetical protein
MKTKINGQHNVQILKTKYVCREFNNSFNEIDLLSTVRR